MDPVKVCLKSNKKLKTLDIQSQNNTSELVKALFLEENFQSELSFKLQTFGIGMILTETQLENFNSFLKIQSATLETLKIKGRSIDDLVLETILSMPRLKKLALSLNDVFIARLAAVSFETNFSVNSLHLCDISENIIFLTILLKVFPRLESLNIHHLGNEVANMVSEKCNSLKQLTVGRFTAEAIADETFFLNLRKFNCSAVIPASKKLFKKLNGEFISSANYENQMWSC